MTRDAKRFLSIAAACLLVICIISIVFSALGSFGPAVGDMKTYEVEGEIKTLEIEINAADFRIVEGDGFLVESNLSKLRFRQSGERLILKDESRGNKNYKDASLVLYIPEGWSFDKVEISTGAGVFYASLLSAKELDLDFGAGEIVIDELCASRDADIEGGAGEITVKGGILNNPDIEMGAGELNLTSEITGNADLSFGVGEANITLIGDLDDYTIKANKGIGSIFVDGTSLSGGETIGNGSSRVVIDGGIGSINIYFN